MASQTARFRDGYESALDQHFKSLLTDKQLAVPGLVVLARRGDECYHKAFGMSDLSKGRQMRTDAMFRMYSMTKVMTSFLALRFYEEGLLDFNDPVSKYIPSFHREWEVVKDADDGGDWLNYRSMLTGRELQLRYERRPAKQPILIKHLLSETSGIEYDLFSEYDFFFGGGVCDRSAGMIANGLRQQLHEDVYRSSNIVGAALTLEQFVDTIGRAGVLTCEPGEFSYGHGATVLGRVLEVVYQGSRGKFCSFSQIMSELLFEPLGMQDAAFFLADDDPRIDRVPTLYGAKLVDDGERTIVLEEQDCYPDGVERRLNQHAHYQGPRCYESGDTGAIMTAGDYARFYDMLLSNGVSQTGERLLSPQGVRTLCKGRFRDLRLNTQLAKAFGVAGEHSSFPKSFHFGWATAHGGKHELGGYSTSDHYDMSHWGGYALTQGFFYLEEDSYMLVCPQLMLTTPGAFVFGQKLIRDRSMEVFHSVWA
jgi:CubicO group peptidase (beta-lactamase class C family)